MGARLVEGAYAFANETELEPKPKLLLAYMALHAVDSDPNPRSYLGRDVLAYALGTAALVRTPTGRWVAASKRSLQLVR